MSASPARIQARFRREHPGFTLDVDLDLPGRGITAIFGHSGSGKTTLLRLIAGLEQCPGGRLSVGGEIWQDDAGDRFTPVHRRALGYVFQDAALFPHLTVSQNLEYGRKRRNGVGTVDANALIRLLGIGHLLARRPATLSGGERQRVAIARALLAEPRILLMDEPLAALDLARRREILPYLEKLHDTLEIPVLYVSHSPDEVARLADHLVMLEAGRVIAAGPLAETLSRLDLPSSFTDDVGVVIEGRTVSYDAEYKLLSLGFGNQTLRLIHTPVAMGTPMRVQIKSRDVSLTLQPNADTSILNRLSATVTGISRSTGGGHMMVGLDVGGVALTARITRYSSEQLGLRVGMSVQAQIKAVSVLS